jgi:hypothetical protein
MECPKYKTNKKSIPYHEFFFAIAASTKVGINTVYIVIYHRKWTNSYLPKKLARFDGVFFLLKSLIHSPLSLRRHNRGGHHEFYGSFFTVKMLKNNFFTQIVTTNNNKSTIFELKS